MTQKTKGVDFQADSGGPSNIFFIQKLKVYMYQSQF